jgi:HD-GYP domain-containing protein (c-di-GMP phosphodiesterase class II)
MEGVSDVYEGLTSRRADREALRHREALGVMRGMGGFDLAVLAAVAKTGRDPAAVAGRLLAARFG